VFPREQVFAQIALGFLVASESPLVVGLNLVAPEDDRVSLADYSTHMRIIGALRGSFPGVGIALHAGELTLGLVPPEELRFHIAEAVRIAGAQRIGHGVDIAYENDFETLLHEMASRSILVEINLTSNAVILGVEGMRHPFETYRQAGVPLALSTDDEGVSRIDLTHEYQRAVETYDLDYSDLKTLARNSLTHAFVEGASLGADRDGTVPVAACAGTVPGDDAPDVACSAFLEANTRARLQWELEAGFHRFERSVPTMAY
jgi:adenosine deaminase